MFNQLVVSTNERRRGRIARFFFGTSAIYAIVIAGVLALSVMVSTPRLADSGERMLALLTPPPGPPPPPQHNNTPPPVAPRNDPTQFRDLDRVLNAPPQERRPLAPPNISDPVGAVGVPDGAGPPDGIGSVPGSSSHSETPAPPPPPRTVEPPHPAPQVDTTHPLRLSTGVLQGKAIVRRTPEYPPLARQIHLAGSVSVEVMIAPDGRVEAARAISGHPLLVPAAVEAARGWRFEPTRLNGTAVRVTGVIVFNFTMQ